jgi:hypothetical protein
MRLPSDDPKEVARLNDEAMLAASQAKAPESSDPFVYTAADVLRARAVCLVATAQRVLHRPNVTVEDLLAHCATDDEGTFWNEHLDTLETVLGWYVNRYACRYAWEVARERKGTL